MNTYFTQLDNGMRVVSENIPYVDSVSLGFWLVKGSRHENPAENGMFHFIEHTLFKGTPRRSARQIAEAFDGVGGSLDAHTGKEETCFSFRLRAKHLEFGLDILTDMLQHPAFEPEELDRERQVILEEIKMAADDPEDLAFESIVQAYWQGHSLGRPILGEPDLVRGFDASQVGDFHRRHYRPEHMVVAGAGNLDHDQLVRLIERYSEFPETALSQGVPHEDLPPTYACRLKIDRPHLEQATFCLLFPGLPQNHPEKPALAILSTLLGGGMSSRLFQKIREEHGLAYSVGSFFGSYADVGYVAIYGSCSPENLAQVTDLIRKEIKLLQQFQVAEEELHRAREQCIGGMVLAMEHSATRAGALAKAMHYDGKIFDLQAKIKSLQTVAAKDLLTLARNLLCEERMGSSVVGAMEKTRLGSMLS